MELLLGCGNNRTKRLYRGEFKEWTDLITLDMDPSCKPDVIHDLNNRPLPFQDNTFDEVFELEVLEHHGGPQGNFRAWFDHFSEIYRILKPDGYYFCTTPHWQSPWAWGDPGHVRVIPVEMLTFLDQTEYTKQVGHTPLTDYRWCYKADFSVYHFDEKPGEYLRFVLQAKKPARTGSDVVTFHE